MIRGLVIAAALLAAGPAAAHRGHAVLTVVEIDPATRVAVVTHRFAAHDVEPALVAIAPEAQPSLDDPAAVEALQDYVADRFEIGGEGGRAALSLQSFDAAGDEVTMVFQVALPADESVLVLDSNLLEETHADMENQVNVRMGGVTRTLVFRPGDEAQMLDLRR
jgi:hypothetical protein